MKVLKSQGLKIFLVLALVALVGVMVPTVLATPLFQQEEPNAPAVPAAPVAGGSITRVCVVTETVAISGSPVAFTSIPGAACTVAVPAGESALILARFSAESSCVGGPSWCTARILIGGVEANPVVGTDFAFDSPGGEPLDSWESHSMDRSRVVGPGTYVVQVQWAVVGAPVFRLDDWSLIVERSAR
jgi:hypothetical protein